MGFNRYMVECEYQISTELPAGYRVLIDTWWNVNVLGVSGRLFVITSFNRYMVECECM